MDDLINEFITETTESIATLDLELVKLEQNPNDEKILGNIFRIMHTIKGTCGFLGLPRLQEVAHASENVLGKIRDKKLVATPDAITLILESLDNIKGLIEYLSANGAEQEGDDHVLIARLNQFADTGVVGDAALATAKTEDVAPSAAANGAYAHFKGDDDPEMAAAIAKLEAEMAAAAQTPVAAEAKKPEPEVRAAPPKTKAKEAAKDEHGEANQSIRVSIDVLEHLMQTVSELVLTRNQLLQIARTNEDKDFMTPLQQLSYITSELQEGVMKTRMQPIGNAWSKFPRLIRDLSIELGKKIDLQMHGAETELDRHLLEIIKDPLTHMVRNSCDHGLETPADRKLAGKPETGTVTLSAYHEGGHIIIEIVDDGRGINIERVKQKAIENGIASEAELETMSEKQIAQFIFAAGFSTAEKVTAVSGRGVGMDVVRTNIQKIGGAIELDSTWGKGSKVAIKIPLTLAIVSVLLVEAHEQKFAIPQINVVELVRVSPGSELKLETVNEALVLRLRDRLLPLAVLSDILGHKANTKDLLQKEMTIAVCKVGAYDFGLLVDRVFDIEEIVVKPVADILKNLTVYSGNTILGDGSVIMILDPNGIAKTLGNIETTGRAQTAVTDTAMSEREAAIGFLLFSLGNASPKAVPLELVSRLEEIDVSAIEIAGDQPVIQYRGELMRLVSLGRDAKMPDNGKVEVIVFTYDKKVIGLVVDEILDIVYAPFAIKTSSKEAKELGYIGSMVIAGRTTDVVDVAYLLSDIIDRDVSNMVQFKHTSHCSLLLVEDSPFFRNLTVPLLSSAGYEVTTAEDGKKALQMLSKKHYDMIVTDIEMPGMNGFEFAASCRGMPLVNGTPIVAYTSNISGDIMKRSREVGMSDCIMKTDRPGLLQTISRCMSSEKEALQ